MNYWIISANSKKYDHDKSFIENDNTIFWRQLKNKFLVNDIVYIYSAKPFQKIMYKCIVRQKDVEMKDVGDTRKYWLDQKAFEDNKNGPYMKIELLQYIDTESLGLDNLRAHNLNGNPQGRQQIKSEKLLDYIEKHFVKTSDSTSIKSDLSIESKEQDIYEGLFKTVKVNRYERNKIARSKCIQHHGVKCSVCEVDFKSIYGEIGNGFIHVHHITPISEIKEEYKVDYKKDLIPVCPNCHAMLHRKVNGQEPTLKQLKEIIKQQKNSKR